MAKIIKGLKRGVAGGASGWTYEFLSLAAKDDPAGPVCALVAELAQRAADGQALLEGPPHSEPPGGPGEAQRWR